MNRRPRISRRRFLKSSALGSAALALGAPSILRAGAPSPLNVAVIGTGGQGRVRLREALSCGAKITALCDVDEHMLELARSSGGTRLGRPNTYVDFRKLLEVEKELEAVIIATPDHWHAPIARAAMAAGKHVFCEKPLTHTISEARELRELARGSKVVTQMGNQGSATGNMRRAIELIQAGAIGRVREVHVWVAPSSSFKAGQSAPVGEDPVPAGLHWDAWVGPAPFHPYKKDVYHPLAWRGWYDFGGGSIADWGCHGFNLPFRALKLDYPVALEADVQGGMTAGYPKGVRVRYEFAARGDLPPVTVWWHDGGRLPPADIVPKSVTAHFGEIPNAGVLMLGDNGFTFGAPHPGAEYIQLEGETKLSGILDHAATRNVAQTLPRVRGHVQEWLDACRSGDAPYSNFEIGGHLTEIALAGLVALRAGKKLDWDGPAMRARNAPEADRFIRTEYRAGF